MINEYDSLEIFDDLTQFISDLDDFQPLSASSHDNITLLNDSSTYTDVNASTHYPSDSLKSSEEETFDSDDFSLSDFTFDSSDDIEDQGKTNTSSVIVSRRAKKKAAPPPLTLRFSNGFCFQFSHAMNSGDKWMVAEVIRAYTHPNLFFRLNDGSSSFQARGMESMIEYFHRIMDNFPDAVMFIKRITPAQDNGIRTLTTKLYFTGTKLEDRVYHDSDDGTLRIEVIPHKLSLKGVTKVYLDRDNRIAVFDDVLIPFQNKRMMGSKNKNMMSQNIAVM
jgi:hypothetical protein